MSDTISTSTYQQLLEENARLKQQLAIYTNNNNTNTNTNTNTSTATTTTTTTTPPTSPNPPSSIPSSLPPYVRSPTLYHPQHTLSSHDISRYGRQLILTDIGIYTQMAYQQARVLIIGAGGLGAPIALYLAGAGVGHIGIVDPDTVDISNLHRQIIHSEQTLGVPKAESARRACLALNSSITVTPYITSFSASNAISIASSYDILVDASDNVATRYCINDTAIVLGRCVVSGSALRLEGQVTVYGYNSGPCYRCLYPTPPPAITVANCNDAGVLGAITGVIGSLQAVEVLKIIGLNYAHKHPTSATNYTSIQHTVLSQRLLIYDGTTSSVHVVKLRPRNKSCLVCGDHPTITRDQLIDYVTFCSSQMNDSATTETTSTSIPHMHVHEYTQMIQNNTPHLLLDVREPVQHDICSLPGAINMPISSITSAETWDRIVTELESIQSKHHTTEPIPVVCLCRRGVFSAEAARVLQHKLEEQKHQQSQNDHSQPSTSTSTSIPKIAPPFRASNLAGGLLSWTRVVDPTYPVY